MTTLNDIKNAPVSGLNHIDALLDAGPHWNLMSSGSAISYTFSTSAGLEPARSAEEAGFSGAVASFSGTQQQGARDALFYLSQLTGILFVETANGNAADLHFANADLNGPNITGLCSRRASYSLMPNGDVVAYAPDAYVYLDNVEFAGRNASLFGGSFGFETLLHELGHALGLKHPFEDGVTLPNGDDSTAFTLMSYTGAGGPYAQFRPYDIAALNFLYGGDGLRGALGVGTGATFLTGADYGDTLTGAAGNDKFQGNGGNDNINGGGGTDTAIFSGASTAYSFSTQGEHMTVTGLDGIDLLHSIEILQFSDRKISAADVTDSVAPNAPSLSVTKNTAGYVSGPTPQFFGFTEAGATVNVYSGTTEVGRTTANANGLWTVSGPALADGSHAVYATATDRAGNVSAQTAAATFLIDTKAPAVPTVSVTGVSGGALAGNQAQFAGLAEAGSEIHLVNDINGVRTVLAKTKAGADGAWTVTTQPLFNGSHAVKVESFDAAGNIATAETTTTFTVNSSLNVTGTAARDTLAGTSANNAIDGGAGIDTINFTGNRIEYNVASSPAGFSVSGNGIGTDSLANVERLIFKDVAVALDINGTGGQAFRMYAAAFNRDPDYEGLGFWMNARDNGVSLETIAGDFIKSAEFVELYGANPSNAAFITSLYANVMHRPPDAEGFAFWLDGLDRNLATRASVLRQFSESPENKAQVIGAIQQGFEYELWIG